MSDHVLEVRVFHAYAEYRPDCSCGWVGSYWMTHSEAASEHQRHVLSGND